MVRASHLLLVCLVLLGSIAVVRGDDTAQPTVDTPVADAATHSTSSDSAKTEEAAMSYDGFNAEELETRRKSEETHEFQAEVTRLMDIIINSLYSKREIFVREIMSNAADALDKHRYLSLVNGTAESEPKNLDIHISFDKDKKTLTFTDTGVGMTKEELIKNLGVVAKSGTSEFVEAATKGSESDALALIGQFGVGFYSVYLVADQVTVISKNNNDKQYIWESKADRTFTVVEDPRGPTLKRGTQVILKMKSDAEDFLSEGELKKIIQRYSEFVNYPINLWVSKTVEKEVVDEEAMKKDAEEKERKAKEREEKIAAGEEVKEEEELEVSEETEEGGEKKPKMKKEYVQVPEWEQINSVKAIWTRNSKDVTDEEYTAFYKTLTKDENGPAEHIHFKAEGEITFRSILFVPNKAPAALYDKFYEKSTALKLYVRRVMISDEFEDFLPRYLNFIRGVVDSDDLPLNVSRETLAQSRVLRVMAKKITRKVLEMLKKMADKSRKDASAKDGEENKEGEDAEKKDDKKEDQYVTFWKNFGKSIKLGVIDDRSNKPKLAKLLRFQSTKSDEKFIGLEDYVDRMKSDQKYIYYITGENMAAVKNSPFLEKLVKKDMEVLFLTDPLDEYLVQSLTEFDGTQLQSITKEGLKLGDEEKIKAQKESFKDLLTWMEKTYGDKKVERVTISNRIESSPCVLVTSQYGWSANMERIMKAQTFANPEESQYMFAKKTMEINPRHPIIKELKNRVAADADDKALVDLANLLYDSALLTSGFSLKDTSDFASRINRVVSTGLSIDANAKIEEEVETEAAPPSIPEESHSEEAHAEPGHDEL